MNLKQATDKVFVNTFSQKDFDNNDYVARAKMKEILESKGNIVKENPDKYGVDLFVYKEDKHIYNIEVERKHGWGDEDFGFPDINFPERKRKFATLEKPTFFVMFNKPLTRYLIVKKDDLISSPVEIVANKRHPEGEPMFKVSLDKAEFRNV
jgi:hypothetical protein